MKNIDIHFILQNLSQEIGDAMLDDEKNAKIKNLAILLGFDEEKITQLFNEVSNVLMGINDFEELKDNLKNIFNLPDNSVDFAFKKLGEIIFNGLKEDIQHIRELVIKHNTIGAQEEEQKLTEENTLITPEKQPVDNTEEILKVIRNLSQKAVQNTANVIATPVIVKEADPLSKLTNEVVVIQKPIEQEKTPIPEKPNKLLDAMQNLQHPKSKIDTLIQNYNTRNNIPSAETAEIKKESSEFDSPFMIKKPPSFIQKGEEVKDTELPKNDIIKEKVPDILKMKEVRESVDQSAKNIRLEKITPDISPIKEPVRYHAVEPNKFMPSQYEKGKNEQNTTDKFLDLSEV